MRRYETPVGDHHSTGPTSPTSPTCAKNPARWGVSRSTSLVTTKRAPKTHGLLIPTLHELRATQPSRKAQVIPDQGTGSGLTPDCLALHDDGTDSFRRGVDGRPEASGSCTDDSADRSRVDIGQSGRDAPGF